MAKKFHGSYEGMDERRSQERSDAAMMGSARGHSNMPEEVIMKDYPKPGGYMPENLDDTIKGIDKQIKSDSGKHKSSGDAGKY
ncbi:hypothetical protein M0R72_16390 [Candidatus Pacearchaeota archaeon]|nr:hypothetical protein [Candidatus Pacearchaeota archaeon]